MARKQNAEEFVRFGSFRFAESFVGSRTYDLQDGKNINALAADQLALGTVYLSQAVPNFSWRSSRQHYPVSGRYDAAP